MVILLDLGDARQQQTCKERIEQTREADTQLHRVESVPATDDIAVGACVSGVFKGDQCEDEDHEGQQLVGELMDEESVKDVRNILKEKRPGRSVQRMHFSPASYIKILCDRCQKNTAQEEYDAQFP